MLMTINRRHAFIACLILLLIVIGYYSMQAGPKNKKQHKPAAHPDYQADEVVYKVYNKRGMLHVKINTSRLAHFRSTNVVHFIKPRVEIRQNTLPWVITADRGESDKNAETITFTGHVRLQKNASGKQPKTTITMHKLIYYPKAKRASSDSNIILQQGGVNIRSRGMRADLDKQQIDLLHDSRGHYAPHS